MLHIYRNVWFHHTGDKIMSKKRIQSKAMLTKLNFETLRHRLFVRF